MEASRRTLLEAGGLLGLSAVLAVGTFFLHPKAPALYEEDEPLLEGEVSREMVATQWGDRVFWIDARPPEAFAAGRQPGAVSLGPHNLESAPREILEQLFENELPIVVYCSSKRCQASEQVADYLGDRGFEVHVLRGGWKAFAESSDL